MPKIIISDTSTLILFHKIDEFNLLQKVTDFRIAGEAETIKVGETKAKSPIQEWMEKYPGKSINDYYRENR